MTVIVLYNPSLTIFNFCVLILETVLQLLTHRGRELKVLAARNWLQDASWVDADFSGQAKHNCI